MPPNFLSAREARKKVSHMKGQIAEAVSIPEQDTTSAELLPLDAPQRVAAYSSGGKIYRHTFRRISAEEWANDFFLRIVAEFRQTAEGYEQVLSQESACLSLYARAAVSAEGFKLRDGDEPMHKWPSWPNCVPQNHRIAAVELLAQVVPSQTEQENCPDGVSIAIDALWSESAAGEMKRFQGLIHRFAYPTREHSHRFLIAKSRSLIVGGTRMGTTRLQSPQATLTRLYDELIQSVEGYSVGGAPLSGREAIIRDMDACHKAVAVQQIFPSTAAADSRGNTQETRQEE